MAKLVEILARELVRWPDCDRIFQDYDGELRYIGNPITTLSGKRVELCEDLVRPRMGAHPVGVTRAEWQAAVDALEADASPASEAFVSDYVDSQSERYAKGWDGVGLPPVGTVCELIYQGCEQGRVEVLFCSRQTTICRNLEDGREQFGETFDYEFRPIRTTEHIAAEDIAEIAARIGIAGDSIRCLAEAIVKAGYRKQEPK